MLSLCRGVVCGALSLIVSACASNTPPNGMAGDPLKVIHSLALEDVQSALLDARAHNDRVAAMCYAKLIEVIDEASLDSAGPAGVVSAFQRARDVAQQATDGFVPQDVNISCAPLVLDAQQTLVRLAAVFGGRAALNGIMVPVP